MPPIIPSITGALTTAKKLMEISEKIKDAELRNLIGDLNLNLADIKVQLANAIEQNIQLKAKIKSLEGIEGEKCPKCRRSGWQLESSTRHPIFGDVGGMERRYKCSLCGFSESKMIVPGMET
jgi:hypothetical protein